MRIKDRPEFKTKPKPLCFRPDQTALEAATRMSELNYGSIVITDADNRIVGLVTERDIMTRLVAQKRDPATTKLSEIMTTDLRVAREDDNLLEWLRMMSNERFRRLPVVDENNRIVAIMTQGDFVSYTWPDLIYQATQVAKATVSNNYQIFLILGGILFYTIALLVALPFIAPN